MKTNLSIFMALCAVIFTNSAMGMERKSHDQLKREFVEANDGKNPAYALEKAAALKKCYDDFSYQREEAEENKSWLDRRASALIHIAVLSGKASIVAAGVSLAATAIVKPEIRPFFKYIWGCPTVVTIASGVGAVRSINKSARITEENVFDREKQWLLKELKSLKTAPVEDSSKQRSKQLNEELAQALKEKQTEKHS